MKFSVFSSWLIECEAWFNVNSIHPSSSSFKHFSPQVHDTNARFTLQLFRSKYISEEEVQKRKI